MHLLVDLENVQPSAQSIARWMGATGKAWIFYGPHQHKLRPTFEQLGERVTLVPIHRPGANSLDFHLVFYLGHLAAGNPSSEFTVLSKDTGYDPAIEHARLLKFTVRRISSLPASPEAHPEKRPADTRCLLESQEAKSRAPGPGKVAAKPAVRKVASAGKREKPSVSARKDRPKKLVIALYRDLLSDLRAPNRPRSMLALKRHIQTRIGPQPDPDTVEAVVARLETADLIEFAGGRLRYAASATES